MKAFREILQVTWTDETTNDWVLRKAGTEPFLLQSVKKRKLCYYGHVLRKIGNCMDKEIVQCTTSAQRRRGRPRTCWQDNLTKWNGLTGDRLLRSIEDRRQWRKIIHEAANPRIKDCWRYKVQVLHWNWCVEANYWQTRSKAHRLWDSRAFCIYYSFFSHLCNNVSFGGGGGCPESNLNVLLWFIFCLFLRMKI